MSLRAALAVAVALASVAAMHAVLDNDFISYDDPQYVTDNPAVRAGLTWQGLSWACTARHAANWHPLTWMSHMLDWELYGGEPRGHHLSSLVLHVVNALLLFLVLDRMTKAPWRSAAVAALFGVHPLHVESVAWVAERKDVLSTLFWMLVLWAYARHAENPAPRRFAWVVALLALGLCAKPMLVTLPFVLLLLDFWPLGRWEAFGTLRLVREKLVLLPLVLASAAITLVVQARGGAVWALGDFGMGVRLLNAIHAYGVYLWKTVCPRGLAFLYPHPGGIPPVWQLALSGIVLGVVSFVAVRERARRPHLLVGWLWYLGTLVPVVGLVQIGAHSTADRYTYVPLVGILLAVCWEGADLWARVRRRLARRLGSPATGAFSVAGVAALLICLGMLSHLQAGRWKDSVTLYRHTLDVTGRNALVAMYLGTTLSEENRHEEALSWCRRAVEMSPGAAWPRNALGAALLRARRHDEALRELETAVRIDPGYADAQTNLGSALMLLGRVFEGTRRYEEAIRLDPDNVEAHTKLGLALARRGDLEGSMEHLARAIELRPDAVEARQHLAMTLYLSGDPARARSELRAVERLGAAPDPILLELLDEGAPEPSP